MYILYTLITVAGWGISPLFVKKSYSKYSVVQPLVAMATTNFIIMALGCWIMTRAGLIEPVDLRYATGSVLVSAIMASLYITYFEGLKRADVSITAALTSFYPLISIGLGVIYLNERTNLFQVGAIGGVVAGMVLMGQQPRVRNVVARAEPVLVTDAGSPVTATSPVPATRGVFAGVSALGLLFILVTMLGYGLSPVLMRNLVRSTGTYLLAYAFVRPIVTAAYVTYLGSRGPAHRPLVATDVSLWLGTAIGSAADLTYVLAVMQGTLIIVIPLSALYPLVTMLLARAFLGDRLGRAQYAGILMGVCFMALALLAGRIGS